MHFFWLPNPCTQVASPDLSEKMQVQVQVDPEHCTLARWWLNFSWSSPTSRSDVIKSLHSFSRQEMKTRLQVQVTSTRVSRHHGNLTTHSLSIDRIVTKLSIKVFALNTMSSMYATWLVVIVLLSFSPSITFSTASSPKSVIFSISLFFSLSTTASISVLILGNNSCFTAVTMWFHETDQYQQHHSKWNLNRTEHHYREQGQYEVDIDTIIWRTAFSRSIWWILMMENKRTLKLVRIQSDIGIRHFAWFQL